MGRGGTYIGLAGHPLHAADVVEAHDVYGSE